MAKNRSARPRIPVDSAPPLGVKLSDLLGAGKVDDDPTPSPAISTAAESGRLEHCGKIVVRREKSGRGGKTVTIVSGLGPWLSPSQREQLAKALRQALGTGSTMEGDEIALQGAVVDRVAQWLRRQGARQVVQGN